MYHPARTPTRPGQTLLEYSLLVMLIGALVMGAMTVMGASVTGMFSSVNSAMGAAPGGGSGGPGGGEGPTAGAPESACASGFEPGSEVAIHLTPLDPGSLVSGDEPLATFTADGAGEVCEDVTLPVDVPAGDYQFDFVGIAPGGAPLETSLPPMTITAPTFDMTVPTPPEATASVGTMTVRVRSCSAIYHRANATMNSAGYLLMPGTEFEVYATHGWWTAGVDGLAPALVGGTWPTYSCDGGSDNTWFQLTDGSGYVFTGGVDIVDGSIAAANGTVLFNENFDADNTPDDWSGLATDYLQAGRGRTADGATALGPAVEISAGDLIYAESWRSNNGGIAEDRAGFCFRTSPSSAVNVATDCHYVTSGTSGWHVMQVAALAPAGTTHVSVYLSGNSYWDDVVMTRGAVVENAPVVASGNFNAGPSTDQGDRMAGGWESTTGVGGSGAMAGTGVSSWIAVGPNKTVQLSVDARTNGGIGTHYMALQVGLPGDPACSSPTGDPSCQATQLIDGTYRPYTVTITTGATTQWVRVQSIISNRYDNLTLTIVD